MKNKQVILDTSIVVDHIRQKKKESTILYKLASDKYALYASIITHTELYAGKSVWETTRALSELEAIFINITFIPLSVSISKHAGKLRTLNGLPLIDSIIAATALDAKLPLATLNHKDFAQVNSLKLIK